MKQVLLGVEFPTIGGSAWSKPLIYADEVDPAWSAAAIETFQVTPHPDSEDPVKLELDGLCPRCKDHMQHTEFLIAFTGVSSMSPDALRATVKTTGRKSGEAARYSPRSSAFGVVARSSIRTGSDARG